jgi:hypothetical protein
MEPQSGEAAKATPAVAIPMKAAGPAGAGSKQSDITLSNYAYLLSTDTRLLSAEQADYD